MFKKAIVLSFLLAVVLMTVGASFVSAQDVSGQVGIVLPTRDEPRWVQDESRFQDALTAAGYNVRILFSQGDSARERANVEDLITQGIKVLIITPQ
ncbi:MAG: substrate-binding domain-containing protein, partial [Anaerolineae bacterium]|nr:substrate-binding domain-containing protein [Anaerolineae bacterium]